MKRAFTTEELSDFRRTYKYLLKSAGNSISAKELEVTKRYLKDHVEKNGWVSDAYDQLILPRALHTALIISEEIGLKGSILLAVMLSPIVMREGYSEKQIKKDFGEDVSTIIHGLIKTSELYQKHVAIDTENFRKLLLSFAEDIRVILIMIADRLHLMREAKNFTKDDLRLQLATEAAYLYAPISHRLGLYRIKSEMEDLTLKFQDREAYDYIARKLNETKRSRDKYIAEFIAPVEEKLQAMGLNFDIKGRTKSISSIRNKLVKQKIEFESIYDLFAIRVILDTSIEKEKNECWQVYSVITDMYQPNPKRMKDWLSIPKSNGYESLHTTVMGPEGKWVEVQIRSKRMDEIAERGLAAHWKYKGIKEESGLDEWMNNVRAVLEQKDSESKELLHDFKMDLYEDEIFVFTPKGDLFRLPKNATVLDFAFAIHTSIGSKCVSAKINGKNVPIKHKLQSGDQVDILTSPNQTPKQDWLTFAVTSKARVRIKQSLKEQAAKQVAFAKELLARRFKNRKVEEDEPKLMRLIKKKGYRTVTDFYADIASEKLDPNTVIDQFLEFEKREEDTAASSGERSIENFTLQTDEFATAEDELVIDENLTGIDYSLAKCCNPIYGDPIFGFVSTKGIKIHRRSCPNAPSMMGRYGYRIVKTRWAGKSGSKSVYSTTLNIYGQDDIDILSGITSMITKEAGVSIGSIYAKPHDGMFQANITILIKDTTAVNHLIGKLRTIKGVKEVVRA